MAPDHVERRRVWVAQGRRLADVSRDALEEYIERHAS
jgi:hypothetical protein